MLAFVSSALAAAEFHSLSPPCDHSADTPGPFIPHPGAFAFGRFIQEGFRIGSPLGWVAKPRMFSASYQRYSEKRDSGIGRRGDAGILLSCWASELSSLGNELARMRAITRIEIKYLLIEQLDRSS